MSNKLHASCHQPEMSRRFLSKRRLTGIEFNIPVMLGLLGLHFWLWLLARCSTLDTSNTLRRFLRFLVVAGPRNGQQLEVPAPTPNASLLIGRTREVAIFIDATDVSRRHAEIFVGENGRLYIQDLGSRNGTLVNGQPATQQAPLPLSPGHSIVTGGTQLIFEGLVEPLAAEQPLPTIPQPKTYQNSVSQPSMLTTDTPTHAYLVLRANGQRFLLEGEEVTVGRTTGNQVIIDAKSVSRFHAQMQQTVASYTIKDLGSTNKTFVNNQPVVAPTLLRNRDLVRFGEVETIFLLENQRLTQEYSLPDNLNVDVTNPDSTNLMNYKTQIEGQPTPPPEDHPIRRNLEHGETRLNLDMRDARGAKASIVTPWPTSALPSPVSAPVVVKLEQVFKEIGVKPPLRNITLTLAQGELAVLYGLAGSGANVLANILAGIEAADRGNVQILGRTLPTLESSGKRKLNLEDDKELLRWRITNVGFLHLTSNFNNRQSVFENIASLLPTDLPDPRARREQAWEHLRSYGLTNPEFERLRPSDLLPNDKQKLALARTIIANPPFLILTEPAQNLSGDEPALLFEQLSRLTLQGKTILVVTQDQFWLRTLNRHYEIVGGQLMLLNTLEPPFRNPANRNNTI